MKLRIEFIPEKEEEEIIVRCRSLDENIKRHCEIIEKLIHDAPAIIYFKDGNEYYLPSSKVLFFETDGEDVVAHTAKEIYKVSYRLYQLEEILPPEFVRISKSTVANTSQIVSVSKNMTSTACIGFFNTHKQVYVSKYYYKELKRKLSQKRR